MFLRRKLNKEGGFTLAEIFVAGLIMVVALIPIVRMFDTSFSGIRNFENIMKSVDCAKTAMEEIRSMPFYEPYNSNYGDVDIDDRFWGNRTPINDNPADEGDPDWEAIPESEFYSYNVFPAYESYRVGVKLGYLDDDTGMAAMKTDWGPKTVGDDRPMDDDNVSLHLVLVQVNVYWYQNETEKSYTLEGIVTDTEAIYNLGISSITVLGPPEIQDLDEIGEVNRPNAASHWSDPNVDVQVEVSGWGFDAATVTASLVRDKNSDIPLTLSYKDDTTLRGTLKLYNSGTDIAGEDDWAPKAAIGTWTVRVHQQDILSAYLYEGFIVQYPKPVIADFGNSWDLGKVGDNTWSAATLRVVGGPFTNQVKNPAARLIRYGDQDEILDQINGTVTSMTVPAGSYGYAFSPNCTIDATFDFTAASPGEYYMEVVNTDEPSLVGHVSSDFKSSPIYTIQEVVPVVDEVYVYGTDPHAHSCAANVGNPWRLVIEGNYFNMVGSPPVEVYICSNIAGGLPDGEIVQGVVQNVFNYNIIIADFDFTGKPESDYYCFVRNTNNGTVGWSAATLFTLTAFSANIGGFIPDPGYEFYENYYDIPSKITGNGFSAATEVSITDGSVEYSLAGEYTIDSDNQISVNLNLIDCDNTHNWFVRVYFGASSFLARDFDIFLGHAVILPASDTKNAISIYSTGWWFTNGWSYETTGSRASARRSRWYGTATGRFEVLGMGFPINGQTTLEVWRGSWLAQSDLNCTMDRANKEVLLTSPNWNMPDSTGDCGISVQRVGDATVDSYATRWTLVN